MIRCDVGADEGENEGNLELVDIGVDVGDVEVPSEGDDVGS